MLTPGARLGAYEILAPLGAGGMGEVYRARDTRLGREAAIKVLPAEVSSDASRLKRFEREARAASALNHPNIVTIYEVGVDAGASFIAMELVNGRTLREIVAAGSPPVRRLLSVAAPLADGLASAHDAGIVHRDLKPENVMVTKDGVVKILDFGLAKLSLSLTGGEGSLATVSRTEPGGLLGTVSYMSPEQAAGQPADFRSDQFSLGSMLYELASGKKAFHRATAVDTLAAILHEEPEPLATASPQTPVPLRWAVERCLAKDPAERYASTRDLARDLAALRSHVSTPEGAALSAGAAGETAARKRRLWLGGAVAVAILAAILALALRARSGDAVTSRRLTFQSGVISNARFAPDGETVVYSAAWQGRPQEIFVMRAQGSDARSLGLPPAQLLSVSPQGELAILLKQKYVDSPRGTGVLARTSLFGGTPRPLLEDVDRRMDWGAERESLCVVRRREGRERLEYPLGRVLFETVNSIREPRVAPSGNVAFVEMAAAGERGVSTSIVVVEKDGQPRVLESGFARLGQLAWSPDGKEVWFSGSKSTGLHGLFAAKLSGGSRLLWRSLEPPALLDVSRTGRALVRASTSRRELWYRGAHDASERELSWLDQSQLRDLSWDGRKILMQESGQGGGDHGTIFLRDTDGSAAVRLGEGEALGLSPDGKWALSLDDRRLVILPTGPGQPRSVGVGDLDVESAAWVPPDAGRLLLNASVAGHRRRGYLIDLAGGPPRPLGPDDVYWGALSNDGTRVIAGRDGKWAIWSIAGRELSQIPGLEIGGRVGIIWNADGTAVYITRGGEIPLKIQRIDLKSGEKTIWKEFQPSVMTGVVEVAGFGVATDENTYVYGVERVISSDLYVVEGLH